MHRYLYTALILLLLVGSAHATLSFSNDDNSNAPLYYLPITLNNLQGTTIASGTEVCIGAPTAGAGCFGFNPGPYAPYMALNAKNVNFQDGAGNLLDSWVETPGPTTNNNILWWVKTNASLGANSTLTIYMVFVATGSSSMSTSHTGAGPLYDSTYAHYDNGSSVFRTQYTDFSGTSTPTGWAITQSTPSNYFINNGVYAYGPGTTASGGGPIETVNGGVCETTGLTTSTTPTIQSVIAEWYESSTASEALAPLQIGTYSTANGCVSAGNGFAAWNYSHAAPQDSVNSTDPSNGVLVAPINITSGGSVPNSASPFPTFVGSVYTSNPTTNGATGLAINYGAFDKPAGVATLSSMGLGFTTTNETGFDYFVPSAAYWARWRSYPPNGVEPTATYGQLSSVSTLAPLGGSPATGLVMSKNALFRSSNISPSAATVSLLQTGTTAPYNGSGGDFTTPTFYANAGDTIVVTMELAGKQAAVSPAISLATTGYTWHATTVPTVSGGWTYGFFYAFNVPGGAATFTTSNISNADCGIIYAIYDISNLNGTLDQTVNSAGSGHVAATTGVANEVAISITTAVNDTGTRTAETGYTLYPTNTFKTLFLNSPLTGQNQSMYVTYNANTGAAGSTTGGVTTNGSQSNTGMLTFETNGQPLPPQYGGSIAAQ